MWLPNEFSKTLAELGQHLGLQNEAYLELSDKLRSHTFSGTMEIHIFVGPLNPTTEFQEMFKSTCIEQGMKACNLRLDFVKVLPMPPCHSLFSMDSLLCWCQVATSEVRWILYGESASRMLESSQKLDSMSFVLRSRLLHLLMVFLRPMSKQHCFPPSPTLNFIWCLLLQMDLLQRRMTSHR